MKRIFGWGVGVVYIGLVAISFSKANAGWETGYTDLGFWWTVIAVILAIAATGAFVGTYLHTRQPQR